MREPYLCRGRDIFTVTDNAKIKVLVVDDAAFMRKAVPQMLAADPGIELAGSAQNGLEALKKIRILQPDVVTLDIDMPIMDGLTAIKHIMIKAPVPIVVLSSMFTDGAVTFEALRLGVMDFLPKPSGNAPDIEKTKQHLTDRIKMASFMEIGNVRRVRLPKKWSAKERLENLYRFYPLEYLIVIGTTVAGPNTVIRLLSRLSPTIPAAVIVMQDISSKILSAFADQFNRHVTWRIEAARDGLLLEQGTCYISSNEHALRVRLNEKGDICLSMGEDKRFERTNPLNLLFSSAAEIFHQNTVGVLLSGVGDDGAEGFAAIKKQGGVTLAKDTRCCVFPNLTDNAVRKGVVDIISDDHKLAGMIESLVASQLNDTAL
jgi:two-component system chemotaxis response regulator CheB